jgi:energy-coupling factor transporter ATP-binding protein EcfA2
MNFRDLNFGAPAAERDIGTGLSDYFVESETFHRVEKGEKLIILGNRGSGKSAIFKVLATRARLKGQGVIELSPEDYSYEMLRTVLQQESEGAWAKHGAFAAAWKYLIYVLIMKEVNQSTPRIKTGAAAKIYTYLRDNHLGEQENPIAVLISYLKRIEGLKVGSYEAAVKSQELARLYKLEPIVKLLPCLIELCDRRPINVFVDELDRGWDASEDSKAFVSGLFQACVSINEHAPNLRVYVSLRRELYDSIPSLYEDAQKYRDIIETITWDETSLLSLIAKRIRHSMPELAVEPDDVQCWNTVFSETLDYRQNKSFNYLIDRTLYRPREIIQFCTDSADEAKKTNAWPINYGIISSAEVSYSGDRLRDIAAEYRFQYPGLISIFEVFRGKVFTFDRDELELICLAIATGEYRIDSLAVWALNQDPGYLIEILWRIGFLRAQAVGGVKAMRRSGSSYLGSHQVENLNLGNLNRFQVHPMFRAHLGMKEPKGGAKPDE